jgi:hypothetical protein
VGISVAISLVAKSSGFGGTRSFAAAFVSAFRPAATDVASTHRVSGESLSSTLKPRNPANIPPKKATGSFIARFTKGSVTVSGSNKARTRTRPAAPRRKRDVTWRVFDDDPASFRNNAGAHPQDAWRDLVDARETRATPRWGAAHVTGQVANASIMVPNTGVPEVKRVTTMANVYASVPSAVVISAFQEFRQKNLFARLVNLFFTD